MIRSSHTPDKQEDIPGLDPTRIRYLNPQMCRIHLGSYDALHVTVMNERIYGGVYAAYAFPVAHAEQYIALIHNGGDGQHVEIGMIRDLQDFPPEQAFLVRQALARRYFTHTILRIYQIRWKFGLVQMNVETDKGPVEFLMRWQNHRALDYGPHGKILIDLYENQFLIPDLNQLTPAEKENFTRFIYW